MVKKREVLSKCPVVQYTVWIFTAEYGLAHVELNLPGVTVCNFRKGRINCVLVEENNMAPDKI